MTRLTALVATAVFALAFGHSSITLAGHDDEFDPCAGLRGSAFGLCHAYTHGMRCGDPMSMADREACERVASSLEEATGSPPPSDCPVNLSLDRVRDSMEGWDNATTAEYSCSQSDIQTGPIPDPPSQFFKIGIVIGDILPLANNGVDVLITVEDGPGPDRDVFFFVRYVHDGVSEGPPAEVINSADPDYAEKAAGFIRKYEACKGAIANLVTSIPITVASPGCMF